MFVARDEAALVSMARAQIEGGASCIDLNASMLMGAEEDALHWSARIIRDALEVPVMLDSPDARMLARLVAEFGAGSILNSLAADAETLEEILPAVSHSGAGVVIMLKDRHGIPASVEGKLALAERAVACASERGVSLEKIFIDPVVVPMAIAPAGAMEALDCTRALKERFPACMRIGGLSNVSFGLPERRLLNRAFAASAVASGMTALICDTTDHDLMKAIHASEVVAGLDPHCRQYLERFRRPRGAA